ncbi:MAG: ATP-binding protein [Anaerolineales bacterium]
MSWGLIGNEQAVSRLRGQITQNRVRHAYLFTGPPAIGKRTLGLRFAQALNCERPGRPGDFCAPGDPAACRVCRGVPDQTDPDLHILTPEESIRVDEIRLLQSRLALAPYAGRWRIGLLPDFHQATVSSANAMLKTLEEPPSRVILLLTSPEQELLLPTVVSRCEVVPLRTVATDTIVKSLQERGLAPERADLLAAVADGRPGRAIALAEDSMAAEERTAALQEISDLMQLGINQRFARVEWLIGKGELVEQRRRVENLLLEWMSLWRDLVHQGYGAELAARNPDFAPAVERGANQLAAEERQSTLRSLAASLHAVEANANLRLTLEALLLELPRMSGAPISEGD